MSTQTEGLTLIFRALLAQEFPLVAERALIGISYKVREFDVSPRGCRVAIRFGRQAFGASNLMDIVREAGLAAQQILCGDAAKLRHAEGIAYLHARRAPQTDGHRELVQVLKTRVRAKALAARDWLMDAEGIKCSARKEADGSYVLRVERDVSVCAKASIRLFNEEWKACN